MLDMNVSKPNVPNLAYESYEYSAQMISGLLTFPLNFVLFLSCVKHKTLRRRNVHILLAALSFGQVVDGLASILAGIDRLYTVFYQPNLFVTSWTCFCKPYILLWRIFNHSYGLVLLVVSIDRLLSVIIPLQHGSWGRKYAFTLISLAHLPLLMVGPYSAFRIHSYRPGQKLVRAICLGSHIHPQWLYHRLIMFGNLTAAFLSVLIYAFIAIDNYKKHKGKLFKKRQQDVAIRHQLRQQRRLTVSIAISTTSILVFGLLPVFVNRIFKAMGVSKDFPILLGPVVIILRKVAFIIDFFVYVTRHKHVKLGVYYLLKCKELTEVAINANK